MNYQIVCLKQMIHRRILLLYFKQSLLNQVMGTLLATHFAEFCSSSIEGAAISSVKIEGVQHEFQSVEGIVEDVTDVVLNLKKFFVAEGRDTVNLIIDVEKDGEITAGDIQLVDGISIVNPEHVICTLNKKQRFLAELEVRVGRGYCPWR